jgi:putative membrane protein
LLASAGSAAAQKSSDAVKFIEDAIRGNLAEVKMGQLAQQHGASDDVRDYGEMLAKDHGKGLEKSSSLAKTLGVTPPTQPSADAAKTYDQLAKLSGKEFDRQFAMHMAMDHQKEIAKYEEEARDGISPEVAAYARETLPTLKEHLEKAQSIDKDLKSK